MPSDASVVVSKLGFHHMMQYCFLLLLLSTLVSSSLGVPRYEPTWESLDKRPLPTWFDDAKIGIFLHWGVFSVPSFHSEWFWWDWQGTDKAPDVVDFMQKNYPPGFTYADFAEQFKAEFFDPSEWADIFQASGAKYVVLTSKHHEGYCNWRTKYSWNWNSVDVGPKRDLVGDLADAIRLETNLRFGVYHSMYEWFNPLYLRDAENNFTTQAFVQLKTLPELYELVTAYKPDVVWSDGDWTAPPEYWNATQFLAWLYNDSPVKDTVVTNDRWGIGTLCKHGGYYTCSDEYSPGTLMDRKWENCFRVDRKSWGYRRNARLNELLEIEELLEQLASTVSCGGNFLLNIGPSREGRIMPLYEERLRQLGSWLKVNGEAIYKSIPWTSQNDTLAEKVWYTSSRDSKSVYAILLYPGKFANKPSLDLASVKPRTGMRIFLLGHDAPITYRPNPSTGGVTIDIPFAVNQKWAWVLKITTE